MSVLHKLAQSRFFKQVFLLAGGTAAAQVINLAILPILTRLYTPNDFGAFAVMTATAAIASVIVSMRYENAIIAVEDAENAVVGTYSVILLSGLVSFVLVFIWLVISIFNSFGFQYLVIGLLSIYLAMVGCSTQALYFLCNRNSLYGTMTKGRFFAAICLAVVSIGWGLLFNNLWGLLLGSVIGMTVNFTYLWFASKKVRSNENSLSIELITRFLKLNSRFPKYLVASSMVDRSGSQGYLIAFTSVYGESVSGALSLYNKVAGLPSVLIGSAIGDVFKRRASEELRTNGECKLLFLKTAGALFGLAALPFLILLLFGPLLFEIVFGAEWSLAGRFAQTLSFVFLLGFVVSPLSTLIFLEENQKYDLLLQAVLLLLLIVSLSLAFVLGDAGLAVTAYAVSYSLKYVLELSICWKIASGEKKYD